MMSLKWLTGVASVAILATAPVVRGAGDAELAILKGHKGSVRNVLFSGDGKKLVSLGEDGKVLVHSPITHRQLGAPGIRGPLRMRLAPDGNLLAVSSSD